MPRRQTAFVLALLFSCLLSAVPGQTTTWTGASTSSPCWEDAANWSSGVPTGASTAVIPVVASQRYPLLCSSASCDTVIVRAGAALEVASGLTVRALTTEAGASINANGQLTISGPVDSRGRIDGQWPVRLTGSGDVRAQFGALEFRATDRTFVDVSVEGSFLQASGILRVVSANFQSTVEFCGTNVVSASATSRLIVGDVTWNTTAIVTDPPRQIDVYGIWNGSPRFAPTVGLVAFHNSSQISQPATLRDVFFDGGSSLAATLRFAGSAEITGQLTSGSPTQALTSVATSTSARIFGTGSVDYLLVDGSVTLAGITVTSDLDVRSLSARVGVEGTVTVRRDLFVRDNATHLVGPSSAVLRVTRDFECAGYYEVLGDLEVGRNLRILNSATFTPTEGRIVFNGTGTRTMTSATSQPERARPNTIVVQSGVTLQMQSMVDIGSLQVSGTVQVGLWANGQPAPNQRFARDVRVASAGRFTYSDTTVPFRVGNLVVDGTATVVGPTNVVEGDVVIRGTWTTDSGSTVRMEQTGVATGSFRNVVVAGVQRSLVGAAIQGNLSHTAGVLKVGQATVTGSFTARGVTLADNGAAGDLLAVTQGVVVDTSADSTVPPTIRLGGNWQSSATFRPTSGSVIFEGNGARTATPIGSSPIGWHDLEVGSTTVLALSGDLLAHHATVRGRVTTTGSVGTLGDLTVDAAASLGATSARLLVVAGSLEASGVVDAPSAELGVGRNVEVGTRLSVGSGHHQIGGSLDALGSLTFGGGSRVTFFGSGRIVNTSTSLLPDVEIAGAYGLDAAYVGGSLTQLASSTGLDISLARIAGDATFLGGRIIDGTYGSGLLEVGGNVTLAGAGTSRANPPPEIRCGGNWTANAAFAPTDGRVLLTGSAGASLTALDSWLNFHDLIVQRPCIVANTSVGVIADAIHIEPNGRLDVGGRFVQLYCDAVDCRGSLAIASGGQLRCGPVASPVAAVFVAPGGLLRTVGAPGSPAVLRGTAPGSYLLGIAGGIEANEYEFRDMAPQGVILAASATIGAAPLDLRGGVFGSGAAAPGSVLLEIERMSSQSPLQLTDVVFDNFPATARYNVRTRTTGRIALAATNGNFYGAEFEDDPNDVIDWLAFARSEVAFTAAEGGLDRVRLAFASTREVDAVSFAVWRGESATGPAPVLVGSVAAAGAPRSYEVVDGAPLRNRRNYYFLVENHRRGVGHVLATTSANALPPSFAAVRVVGRGGFPDIGAALAAGPGVTVLVESGVYPPFRLNFPAVVRALPGADVRIDASSGPVIVEDVTGDAGLHDLTITATTGPALVVRRCPWVLLLDRLRISSADPAGALRLSDCVAVAMQWSEVAGAPAECVRTTMAAWGGVLSDLRLLDSSRLVDAGLSAVRTTVDATSTRQALGGVAPRLDGSTTWHDGMLTPQVLTSNPGDVFVYLYSLTTGFYDLRSLLPVDMLLLLGADSLQQVLFSGIVDASGEARFAVPVPSAPELWGLSLNTQALAFGLRSPPGRFSSTQRVVLAP